MHELLALDPSSSETDPSVYTSFVVSREGGLCPPFPEGPPAGSASARDTAAVAMLPGAATENATVVSDMLAALSNGHSGAPHSAEARIKLLERRMTGGP